MKIFKYLNQPFPKPNSKWNLIIFVSLFIVLFLLIFKPFGILLTNGFIDVIMLSGYGFVTFVVLVLNLVIVEKIFYAFFSENNWTIWKEFTWLIWNIFLIGVVNALYTIYFVEKIDFDLFYIFKYQRITMSVAIVPITILIVSKHSFLKRKHEKSAVQINNTVTNINVACKNDETITFGSENKKEKVEFLLSDFYYIESSGNYIDLYIQIDNKIVRKTFRGTLKRSLEFFKDFSEVVQCHRAYIVNTSKITNVKGNSQGLRLYFECVENYVPVSRGNVKKVQDVLG